MRAADLTLPDDEIPALEVTVQDLDAAAALCRIEWPYAEEPLTGFRFPPA